MTKAAAKPQLTSLPNFIVPCLATLTGEPPDGDHWVHEIKFDGYRLQARIDGDTVQLLTRSGLDWTEKFAPLAKALLSLNLASAIIDGEVIVEDEQGAPSFAELVGDLKARRMSRLVYVAFDLLFLDGTDVRARPLGERKALLKSLLSRNKARVQLHYSDHLEVSGSAMLAEACKRGLEGIISKRLDKPYQSGRGTVWLKSKCISSDEFVIAGYLDSTAVENAVGALVVGFYDGKQLVYVGRVGTGFNRRSAGELWQDLQGLRIAEPTFVTPPDATQSKGVVWVKPRLVAQVEYRAWTAEGILRHASFKALRYDKPAREVTDPRPTNPSSSSLTRRPR
jgi:bifunctional non-homologous end joining protein LigD